MKPITPYIHNRFAKPVQEILPENKSGNNIQLETALVKIRELVSENNQLKQQLNCKSQKIVGLIDNNHRILSIIAHDLRSPFNSIVGFLNILKGAPKDIHPDVVNNYLDTLLTTADGSLELLDNLLDWAISNNGADSFNPSHYNLNQIIEKVLVVITPVAILKKIEIINSTDPSLMIYGDTNMIETILRNLITNAVQYSGKRGTVTITATANTEKVKITVDDTGPGISKEVINRLFADDYSDEAVINKEDRWKGLGLLFCKGFVDIHGGTISIINKDVIGSAVTFTIPQKKKTAEDIS